MTGRPTLVRPGPSAAANGRPGTSTSGPRPTSPWHVEGNTVWAIATEWNEYYALIERDRPAQYRITYFLEGPPHARRVTGYMISPPNPAAPSPPAQSRFDEFQAWVTRHHSDEWAYLWPGGSIDPAADRAPRTRKLLNEWRREVGLKPIE